MCGFLVYKSEGSSINQPQKREKRNYYIQKRGQDLTNTLEIHGFTFVHNLLSVTGDLTPQPFVDGKILCVYNGEIYNHPYKHSDGENIIPLYKKYGVDFPTHLDGEWAIALYDFEKGLAIFATDLFATKPIWRNGLEAASYESGLTGNAHKIAANTIEVVHFDVENCEIKKEEKKTIYEWDLRQYKTNYDDWIKAFERAVAKRATPNCFIGLSSGYDSGAIACELLKMGVSFKAYIIEAREDKNVLSERMKLVKGFEYITNAENFKQELEWINDNIEDFRYITAEGGSIKEDKASPALSIICRRGHEEGRKIYLSGQGSDEIMSDYALYPKQKSTFRGGQFPEKLNEDLWENFYNGSQYSYIGKEEYVAGSHAIETRYPFLDKDVVQEFLWLSPALKNRYYKAPIHEYLKRNNFPFSEGKKVGLRV